MGEPAFAEPALPGHDGRSGIASNDAAMEAGQGTSLLDGLQEQLQRVYEVADHADDMATRISDKID